MVCYVCKKKNSNLCSGCFFVSYCSRKCQKVDYKKHKPKCKKIVDCFIEIMGSAGSRSELKTMVDNSTHVIPKSAFDKLIAKYANGNVLTKEQYIKLMEKQCNLVLSEDGKRWIAKYCDYSAVKELMSVYEKTNPVEGMSSTELMMIYMAASGWSCSESPVDQDYVTFRKSGYYGFCHPKDIKLICDRLRDLGIDRIVDPIAGCGSVAGSIHHFGDGMEIDAYDSDCIGKMHYVEGNVDLTSKEAEKLYWSKVDMSTAILISWPDMPNKYSTSRPIMDRALKYGAGCIIIVSENPGCAMSEESHEYVANAKFPWKEVEVPGLEYPWTGGPTGGRNYWRVYLRK